MPNIDRLAFYEDQSSEVYFMNPETGIMNQVNQQLKTLKVEPKELTWTQTKVEKTKDGEYTVTRNNHTIPQKTSLLDILYIADKKY